MNKGIRIMSHVFGFETGRRDGEMEDRHTECADVLFLRVVPKILHNNVVRSVREFLSWGEREERRPEWRTKPSNCRNKQGTWQKHVW